MATGIFAILDDIALLADDVAMASKVATQKTAGILGDDLAVNAQKATGFAQNRELKVLWTIAKGSFANKLIILPISFLLSFFIPWIIPYILVLGGLYLLYEGAEKIVEVVFHKNHEQNKEVLETTEEDILKVESQKIKSAILTDFILSVEIVILALGTLLDKSLSVQIIATTLVAFAATIFVYGLVAMIVRIDNVGFWLISKKRVKSGNFLIALMPKLVKVLSFVGTIAMVLVGGGILAHNLDFFHKLYLYLFPGILNDFIIGLGVGFLLVGVSVLVQKIMKYRFWVR